MTFSFPRSAGRGLIEARLHQSEVLQPANHFRDQLVAASLKPEVPIGREVEFFHFRDQLVAASLKRSNLARDLQSMPYFRDQLVAASLKRLEQYGIGRRV